MADRAQKGLILKKAREAKGISLDAVQDATKIPLDSLKAIEEGYRVRTLTDFYYRAFVKLYARYLGIDVKTIIEDYKNEKVPLPTKFRKAKNFFREKEAFSFLQNKIIKKVFKIIVVIVAFALCLYAGSCWLKSRPAQPRKAAEKVRKIETEKVDKAKAAKEKRALKNEEEKSSVASGKRTNKKINLTIRAKKSTWVSVRVDDVDRLRSTMTKGAIESWSALESIEISGKNLTDLEFELNGQPTNPAGKTRRTIKRIIITRDGFKIQD